jgi:hypothetical protein
MTWSKSIGRATHGVRYRDVRIKRGGTRDPNDAIFNYYLGWSDMETEEFDNVVSLAECHHQASNARAKLKDAFREATTYITSYELEVATATVQKRFPELFENPTLEQER